MGGSDVQEHLGVAAGEREVASGDVSRAFGDSRDVVALAEAVQRERVVDRFEREIGGEPERKSARQKKAVPSVAAARARARLRRPASTGRRAWRST